MENVVSAIMMVLASNELIDRGYKGPLRVPEDEHHQ